MTEERTKKRILLLSDDLRWNSGIATMSRSFVKNTLDRFEWVQLGAAVKHPDEGKVFDMSEMARKEWGAKDPYLKIYATSGYGNQDLIRQLLTVERPDAVLHFTDPRFWIWLYDMEHELREHVPLLFYHIWDDLPFPMYNRDYYESCDWIGCISKQSYNIVKNVWGSKRRDSWKQPEDWQVDYVPHGIDPNEFFPIDPNHDQWNDFVSFRRELFASVGCTEKDIDFVVTWANRNIRRKMPGDIILAYKRFCDTLPNEQADRCMLVMHTAPIDNNGTDLIAVKNEICPDYKVTFSAGSATTAQLNYLFNVGDVTINIASNEGFGLTTCESLMAGTPIIVNVTGGLQDQCGFRDENGDLVWTDHFNAEWGSNHDGRYTNHGEWATPIFPKTISLVGSPPTPYIFDDRVATEDVVSALRYWYDLPKKERHARGLKGREYVSTDYPNGGGLHAMNMANKMAEGIEKAIENWQPRQRYELLHV